MYLHIGNRKSVKKKDIIGIFDLDTSTVTKTGKDFIAKLEKAGAVEYDDDDTLEDYFHYMCGTGIARSYITS